MDFFYTLVQSNDKPLCKEIHKDGSSTAQARLSHGTYKKQHSTLGAFAQTLSELSFHEAIILGVPEKDEGTITTKAKAKNGVIARTKEYFHWPKPFLLMFDYDPLDELGITIDSPKEYATYLAKLDPVFADVELLVVPSSSAYITSTITKKPLKRNGFHCYVVSEDATRIKPYIKSLEYKSWEMGLATYVCSVAGAKLERFIVDTAVFSPERLIYEAKPFIHAPWERELVKPYYQPGIVHPLVPVNYDLKIANENIKRAKKDISPQAKKETDAYFRTNIAPQYSNEEKKNLRKRFQETIETHTLMEDFSLLLETGKEILVSELLKNPQAYDGYYCADPYERDEGNTRAMIQTAYPPYRIHSFLHGGIEYKLPFEPTLKEVPKCEEPVSSQAFINKAKEHFKGKEILFTSGHEKLFESMCHLFNYCTSLNKDSSTTPALHQFPATTGAGKTTAMQLWAAMAPKEVGILIGVYTIESAREIARAINEIAGKTIAKCTYSINSDNPRSHEHVEPHELSTHPVAIITHQKYTNQLATDDEALIDYNNSPTGRRQCIIIDEELALMETESIELGVYVNFIGELIRVMKEAHQSSNPYPDFTEDEEWELREFHKFEDALYRLSSTNTLCTIDRVWQEELQTVSTQKFYKYLTRLSDEALLRLLGGVSFDSKKAIENIRRDLRLFFKALDFHIKHPFFCFPLGKKHAYVAVHVLQKRFGHMVVLDATVELGFEQVLRQTYQPESEFLYQVPPFRTFDNCKIHLIEGDGLFQSKSKLEDVSNIYTQCIAWICKEIDIHDNVLIITHKDFEKKIQRALADTSDNKIEIVHWGNHTGSNKYRHCNKVFAIGWYFLPPEKAIAPKVISAIGDIYTALEDTERLRHYISQTVQSNLLVSFMQALMRSRARIITDIEGRPKPTEFYLFVPTSKPKDIEVIHKLAAQFPKIQLVTHELHVQSDAPPKPLKLSANSRLVLDYLDRHLGDGELKAKDVYEQVGLNRFQFKNVRQSQKFIDELASRGIEMHEGKSSKSGITFRRKSASVSKSP